MQDHEDKNVYKTVILPVILCDPEAWSVTLREEQSESV
jgi:hypothetical protein